MLARRTAAEAIGAFTLVLAGTGAIVADSLSGGAVGPVGVALAFGLAVMVMIQAVGDVSGAHFNPAVTLGFWAARRLPARDVAPYVASQLAGALLASGLLRGLAPAHPDLGATRMSVGAPEAFGLEVVLTFFLMFVILSVSTGAKEKGLMAGIAIGGTVAMGALFGGPFTGASMNPARSLAPALWSGQMAGLWLYLVAPVLGAGLAVLGCRCVHAPGCCGAAAADAA